MAPAKTPAKTPASAKTPFKPPAPTGKAVMDQAFVQPTKEGMEELFKIPKKKDVKDKEVITI